MLKRMLTTSLICLSCALVVIIGCSQQSEFLAPDPTALYDYPDSPDKLMANFVQAYSGMDYEGYAALLHDDFIFEMHPCEKAALGADEAIYDRDQELQVAANMFSGKALTKADGSTVPAIAAIEFQAFAGLGVWEAASERSRYAGALMRTYRVQFSVERPGAPTIFIRGICVFYARESDGEGGHGATPRPYYQLVAWVDYTEGSCDDG